MKTLTLTQRLDAYLSHARAINQSPVHIRQLRFNVLRTFRWLESTHQVICAEQLTAVHLDGWFRHVSTRRTRKGLPLKATSVSKQLQCDRAFFAWLEIKGAVPTGISEALPQVKMPYLLPTSVLDHSKMVRLLERTKTDTPKMYRLRTMMEVLYSSGMRVAELLGLDLESLDLGNLLVRVMGKGEKERVVPIGVTAGRFLEGYLKGIRPLLQRTPGQTALFLDESGQRMPYHTFRRLLNAVIEDSGIKINVTAHTFRRSCATEMIRGGANLWMVGEQLGHANVDTLKHYVKLTAVDLKKSHAKHHPRERDYRARQS
jgi:integrase/recombinase XerD